MKERTSYNSILLAGARLFSTASSLMITMILAKTLDLASNGAYGQCLTVISLGLAIISLGLMEGSNYFFAKAKNRQEQQEYINAILFLVYVSGLILTVIIVLFRSQISRYFSTPMLENLLLLVALRPMLSSLINVLNVLYIATDHAKSVILRNAVISFIHLAIVIFTAYTTKDVRMILALYLLAEMLTDGFMLYSFGKLGYSIKPRWPGRDVICTILRYCLPMAAYIAMNSLLRDTDKLIIGWNESTEMQAIYSNCAKILPVDVISAAFFTVLLPKITRCLTNNRIEGARAIFTNYFKIGMLSTATFAAALMLCPEQAICFLYSKDYLPGKSVFLLYNFVEMMKFANVTIVISAVGKTKMLMAISAITMAGNLIVSVLLYQWFGFAGPAIGTLIITGLTVITLFILSARILKTSFSKLIDITFLIGYTVKAGISAAAALALKLLLLEGRAHQIIVLFAVSGTYCLAMLLLNMKQIRNCLALVDHIPEETVCPE